MQKLNENDFQKGQALLKAGICGYIGAVLLNMISTVVHVSNWKIWLLCAIVVYFCSKWKEMTSEKDISWSPMGYLVYVALLHGIGVIAFLYDLQKCIAKRSGKNINTPKGKLFIVVLIVLFMLYAVPFAMGFIEGYQSIRGH